MFGTWPASEIQQRVRRLRVHELKDCFPAGTFADGAALAKRLGAKSVMTRLGDLVSIERDEMTSCSLRHRVLADPHGTSSDGFACKATGARCVPDEHCDARHEREETRFADVVSRVREAVLAVPGVTLVDAVLDQEDAWIARVVVTGGDDDAVASAIAATLPVWFDTVGSVRVRVPLRDKGITNIAFDRPVRVGVTTSRFASPGDVRARREAEAYKLATDALARMRVGCEAAIETADFDVCGVLRTRPVSTEGVRTGDREVLLAEIASVGWVAEPYTVGMLVFTEAVRANAPLGGLASEGRADDGR